MASSIFVGRMYRHIYAAQCVSLIGTGLASVALGLTAFDLAEADASIVLGIIFSIKMITYVGLAPVAAALCAKRDRRKVLVFLDILRAGVVLAMPFASELWHIYILVLLLHAASAAFTPAFLATIPDIFSDEGDYTRALSASRIAQDLEMLASPVMAAMLLIVIPSGSLFVITSLGFIASGLLILSVLLPPPAPQPERSFRSKTLRGMEIYFKTPRLRGYLALNFGAAAIGATIFVNTVAIVRGELGLSESALALTMFAFGAGSVSAAVLLPRSLNRFGDRRTTLVGSVIAAAAFGFLAFWTTMHEISWPAVLGTWAVAGFGYVSVLTPSGRLLTRSAERADRPSLFAARFALSHGCFLFTYPLAGWLMSAVPLSTMLGAMSLITVIGALVGTVLWPAHDPEKLRHSHPELNSDHPHLSTGHPHSHKYQINDLHSAWPRHADH